MKGLSRGQKVLTCLGRLKGFAGWPDGGTVH